MGGRAFFGTAYNAQHANGEWGDDTLKPTHGIHATLPIADGVQTRATFVL
jgi:hypothetical protein